jgi:NTE family protein
MHYHDSMDRPIVIAPGRTGHGIPASGPSGEPVTAFVLPGGSTMGAVQVGMLRVLVANGILPDLIVATSVGALNAAVFVEDASIGGLEHLGRLWTQAPRAQIFPFTPIAVAQALVRRQGHLLDNHGLRRWIADNISFERLEDARRPLHIIATDAERHEPAVLSRGDAVTALLASSALPGVFPAVWVDGRRMVDGGATANVPVRQAHELGAQRIIVLPTDGGPAPLVGAHRIERHLHRLADRIFGRPPVDGPAIEVPLDAAVVYEMPAPPTRESNPFSFRHAGRLIDEATVLSERWLKTEGEALVG